MALPEFESIFNIAWNAVDEKQHGFIYAKDMPELIQRLNTIANTSLTTKSNDEAILSYANQNPFYKLDKDEFNVKFQSLVGTSLNTAMEMANFSDTKPRLFGSIRRQSIAGDDQIKDELLKKSMEIEKLQSEINDWKGKYQFLEREFMFYQTHHKSISDSTQHEFIISEMKRTIEDQTKMISKLKLEIQGTPIKKPSISTTKSDVLRHLSKRGLVFLLRSPRIALAIAVLTYMLWYMIVSMSAGANSSQVGVYHPPSQSWWERSNVISAFYWYLTDKFESNQVINDTVKDKVSANYNIAFEL
ncbi:HER079Cp [Eremothecium sinecaudum]|uniref:Monopolar spindle protein 2 n=1 Tax=Eremothecium sinecaudum TaxID=45286 RepID=A0A109UZH0_9SACH|nr:HER079Cp [Eremothecium sinecaudum]AMD21358.1 HER079Cp [Eremothecium sinecaudum]